MPPIFYLLNILSNDCKKVAIIITSYISKKIKKEMICFPETMQIFQIIIYSPLFLNTLFFPKINGIFFLPQLHCLNFDGKLFSLNLTDPTIIISVGYVFIPLFVHIQNINQLILKRFFLACYKIGCYLCFFFNVLLVGNKCGLIFCWQV